MSTILLLFFAVFYYVYPSILLGNILIFLNLFIGIFSFIGVVVSDLKTNNFIFLFMAIISCIILYNTTLFWAFIGSILVTITLIIQFSRS